MTIGDPDSPPTAFFTLSMLIDSSQIDALADLIASDQRGRLAKLVGMKKRARFWSQDLLKKIRPKAAESDALHKDINPMFEDISDRARNLFIEDFLLDTKLGDSTAPDHLRNVFAEISLSLDGPVRWKAEGPVFKVDTEGPIVFEKVLCRAFWMAHSNNALSYHLSFEVPFEHGLKHYLGLSLFQKVFSQSETTDWVASNTRGWKVVESKGTGEKVSLLGFMEEAFERDLEHLMTMVSEVSSTTQLSPRFLKQFVDEAWQQLVLEPAGESQEKLNVQRGEGDPVVAAWVDAAPRRRLLVLLRDEASFESLQKARQCSLSVVKLDTLFLQPGTGANGEHQLAALEKQLDRRAQELNVPPGEDSELFRDNYKLWLFLSGFFQNVVDFLDQDGLEIHDGLAPVYPECLSKDDVNPGFMLYATPSVLFEVVSKSRSLDKAGRRWLGTCPYLFLVHMTAFQNESLVRVFEKNVTYLLKHLETEGLKADESDFSGSKFGGALASASACIRDFQLLTFEKVHKHTSFNVFRYQTEQDFFECVQDIRGIKQRRAYWDEVLNKLTLTIESLQEERRARYEKKIAVAGVLLALSGVLQVLLAVFPPEMPEGSSKQDFCSWLYQLVGQPGTCSSFARGWDVVALTLAVLALCAAVWAAGWIVIQGRRRLKKQDSAKAWRKGAMQD